MFAKILDNWHKQQEFEKLEREQQKLKCVFCGELTFRSDKPTVDRVPVDTGYGYYYKSWRYHKNCLLDVINNPQDYNHNQVDTALKITELIDYWSKRLEEARKILDKEE